GYWPEGGGARGVGRAAPGQGGRVYAVIGPEAVPLDELGAIASEAPGAAYGSEPQTRDDWEAKWRGRGKDGWELEAGLSSFDAQVAGELLVLSDDYRLLAGKEPPSIRPEVARHLDAMPLRGIRVRPPGRHPPAPP